MGPYPPRNKRRDGIKVHLETRPAYLLTKCAAAAAAVGQQADGQTSVLPFFSSSLPSSPLFSAPLLSCPLLPSGPGTHCGVILNGLVHKIHHSLARSDLTPPHPASPCPGGVGPRVRGGKGRGGGVQHHRGGERSRRGGGVFSLRQGRKSTE